MLELRESVTLPRLPVTGLRRVRDLLYVDGPLLSQYVHPNGDHFLYHWCESDGKSHRWLLLRVDESSILRMRYRFVPMHHVIPRTCQDDFAYLIDVQPNGEQVVRLLPVDAIPEQYLPQRGVFLHEDATDGGDTFTVLLDGNWDSLELFGFPRLFELVYSFQYAIEGRQVESLREFPWAGGFSSLHFNNWISSAIPFEDRVMPKKVVYASPGFITFSANHAIASRVASTVRHFIENQSNIRLTHQALSSYISNSELRDAKPDDPRWQEWNPMLLCCIEDVTAEMAAPDSQLLLKASSSIYVAAQVARWFYRRIKQLADGVVSGVIKLPPDDGE